VFVGKSNEECCETEDEEEDMSCFGLFDWGLFTLSIVTSMQCCVVVFSRPY